ncbi:MAG: sulfite exporter TauE/SafE family protein [Cyanobacteria bacterium CRU_2_1]|nr:sulfite exporter TauE/SafE family protein [Cyanobacteria bacterium CRU_2_1]
MHSATLILVSGGVCSGILAGLLGIGGGILLVPILIALGYTPIQAISTSSLAVTVISISGSIQNRRMGYFDSKRVFLLGIPAVATAQIGAYLANQITPYLILLVYGIFLLINIYLVNLRKHLSKQEIKSKLRKQFNPVLSRIGTGGAAGILAGLLGGGGGSIMVPLQMLLLGETIKTAIQTSLGVIVCITISATLVHAVEGNILLLQGIMLGIGGYAGAQVSTRVLPKLPDRVVAMLFCTFLATLSIYMFWQAWVNYHTV